MPTVGMKTFRTAASSRQADFDKHSKCAAHCNSGEGMKRTVSLLGVLSSSLLKMSLPYGTFLLVRLFTNVDTTGQQRGQLCMSSLSSTEVKQLWFLGPYMLLDQFLHSVLNLELGRCFDFEARVCVPSPNLSQYSWSFNHDGNVFL